MEKKEMTYLTKHAQTQFYNDLEQLFTDKINAEQKKREDKAKEVIKTLDKDPDILAYRQERQDLFTKLDEFLTDFFNEKDEKKKESIYNLFSFQVQCLLNKKSPYNTTTAFETRESFISKFNAETDSVVDEMKIHRANVKVGLTPKDGAGIHAFERHMQIRNHLKARLTVAPATKYEDIVEKLETEININKFFEN